MIYLNLIVSLQIIFLFILLFFKNNNFLNKLLAVIILVPVFSFCINTLGILDVLSIFYHGVLYFLGFAVAFLFAPLVFYYVSLMCGKKLSLKHPLVIITILVIIYVFLLLFEFLSLDSGSQETYINAILNEEPSLKIVIITSIFILLQQLYFTIAAYKVYVFRKNVANIFSTRSTIKIGFTRRFITLIWVLNACTLIAYIIAPPHIVEYVIIPVVVFIITGLIVYYAFMHEVIFNKETYQIFKKDIKFANQVSIGSQINSSEASNFKYDLFAKEVENFLMESKAYLNLEYTILDLSKELGFPHAKVSSVINKELNKNFSELINDFRIEESKVILKEKFNQINIESIAEQSGFKSRASFYRAFKKKEGVTPSEFIKRFRV